MYVKDLGLGIFIHIAEVSKHIFYCSDCRLVAANYHPEQPRIYLRIELMYFRHVE